MDQMYDETSPTPASATNSPLLAPRLISPKGSFGGRSTTSSSTSAPSTPVEPTSAPATPAETEEGRDIVEETSVVASPKASSSAQFAASPGEASVEDEDRDIAEDLDRLVPVVGERPTASVEEESDGGFEESFEEETAIVRSVMSANTASGPAPMGEVTPGAGTEAFNKSQVPMSPDTPRFSAFLDLLSKDEEEAAAAAAQAEATPDSEPDAERPGAAASAPAAQSPAAAKPQSQRPQHQPPQRRQPSPASRSYDYSRRYVSDMQDFSTVRNNARVVGRRCYRLNIERPLDIHCEQSPLVSHNMCLKRPIVLLGPWPTRDGGCTFPKLGTRVVYFLS